MEDPAMLDSGPDAPAIPSVVPCSRRQQGMGNGPYPRSCEHDFKN